MKPHSLQLRSFAPLKIIVAGLCFAGFAITTASAALLYATGNVTGHGSSLVTLDKNTGTPTFIGETGGDANLVSGGLAYDPVNHVMYATGYDSSSRSALYTLNPTTGAATKILTIASGPINWSFGGLAFDTANNTLYMAGYGVSQGAALYSVNPSTLAITTVNENMSAPFSSPSISPVEIYGLGYDPLTDTLYGNGRYFWDLAGVSSSLWTLDVTSGTPSFVGHHGVLDGRQLYYSGLAMDPDTQALYSMGSTASGSGLYLVDAVTGAAALVGAFPNGYPNTDGALVFVSSVPEPGTALFGIACVGVSALRRRRRA